MRRVICGALAATLACASVPAFAQRPATPPPSGKAAASAPAAVPVPVPTDYVIGVDDQLGVVVWGEQGMTADVLVRPDGKISLPLLNDIQVAGMTVEQLRLQLEKLAAENYVKDPHVSVMVRQINSRKVFVLGAVANPGTYPLTSPLNVLQIIAVAGGLLEYAKSDDITILRTEQGKEVSIRFNYDEVVRRKNTKQNITLRPGDTIVVSD